MDILQMCKVVLTRLTEMDYERKVGSGKHRLIFPNKFPSEAKNKEITEKELLKYTRISEQELRFLFVEQFIKDASNEFFYSVETPTGKKYRFGKTNKDIPAIDNTGRSASIDMCVFKKDSNNYYYRTLNIEFKHQNSSIKSIEKDVLKLIHEKQNGAFILLLKNSDAGTLISVFNKLSKSFVTHGKHWNGEKNKFIKIIILSLEEKKDVKGTPFLKYYTITKGDHSEDIFFIESVSGIKTEIKGDDWKIETIK